MYRLGGDETKVRRSYCDFHRTVKDEFGQAMLIKMIQQEDFRNLLFLGLKQVASNNKAAHPVPFNK